MLDFLLDFLLDMIIYIKILLIPVVVIFLMILFKKVSWIEKVLKEWKEKNNNIR